MWLRPTLDAAFPATCRPISRRASAVTGSSWASGGDFCCWAAFCAATAAAAAAAVPAVLPLVSPAAEPQALLPAVEKLGACTHARLWFASCCALRLSCRC